MVVPDFHRYGGHCVANWHILIFVFRTINISLCIVVVLGLSQAALQPLEHYTAILGLAR